MNQIPVRGALLLHPVVNHRADMDARFLAVLQGDSLLENFVFIHPAADLEEALRINPEFAPAIGQRGMIRVWEKKFKEAVDDLKRAMILQPGLRGTLQPYLDQALRETKRTDE